MLFYEIISTIGLCIGAIFLWWVGLCIVTGAIDEISEMF